MNRIGFGMLLLWASVAGARDKSESWVAVKSQHFSVITDANDKQGRHVADQFERMRSVFQARFPKMQIDPPAPIVVMAVRDEKDFRALEPAAYLAKGQLQLSGLFLRTPEKNYVLMRLNAEGEHPYEVVYHEYTHLLLAKAAETMPLWMNEGLAEFYQTTEIHEKSIDLGRPSIENLMVLRQNAMIPLPTLFRVDVLSPYYHEENKGSIFYAESWALVHYLMQRDRKEQTHHLADYDELTANGSESLAAAGRAFGDLNQLQKELQQYVQQASYLYTKLPITTEIDQSSFQSRTLTASQSDALQAGFLAYNDRAGDARALLNRVLQEDPKSVTAHETMGYLEFREGHLDEAKKWYEQAVRLDSQSYVAHYYFAAISMREGPSEDARVETSLRQAIKLNPLFAPAFDLLAVFLAKDHKNLDEAHTLELTAVSLDPASLHYRLNTANVLIMMNEIQNALNVLHAAGKIAKTPEDMQAVDELTKRTEHYKAAKEEFDEQQAEMADDDDDADDDASGTDKFVAKGPHQFLVGVLKNVRCTSQQLDLLVSGMGKDLALHSEDYYKIRFTTLDFAPEGDLNPCKDLQGRPAKVEYVEAADATVRARVLSIELHK